MRDQTSRESMAITRFARLFAITALVLCLMAATAMAAKVTYLKRPAEVQRQGKGEFATLNMGDEVIAGDVIRTGMGARVEVTISEKRVFRIGQATKISIPQMEDTKAKGFKARFNLTLGRFWGGVVKPLSDPATERFEVATETATIGVKGTSFGVDFNKDKDESSVLVLEGTIAAVPPGKDPSAPVEVAGPQEIAPPQEISRDEWTLLVTRDQKVIIRPGEAPSVEPLTAEDKEDEWVKFNMERDAALAAQ